MTRRKQVYGWKVTDIILDHALEKHGLAYRNLLEPQVRYVLYEVEKHFDIMTKKEKI